MNVFESLKNRQSTRAFLDKPVDQKVILDVLTCASYSPSSTNTQPWWVAVTQGETKNKLSQKMQDAFLAGETSQSEFQIYPSKWIEPYKSRRKACGLAMYSALEIERYNLAAHQKQWAANYRGFDAPVLLFFFIDPILPPYSLLDYGMFLQSVMLGLTSVGLSSCPQAALSEYPDIVKTELGHTDKRLICGMAVGYADPKHPINCYRTERAAPAEFVTTFN